MVMGRPGGRVAKRKQKKARIGFSHCIKREDTMAWFKQWFDGIILVSCIFIFIEIVLMHLFALIEIVAVFYASMIIWHAILQASLTRILPFSWRSCQ